MGSEIVYESGVNNNWLLSILRGGQTTGNALQHLLVILYLFGSVLNFSEQVKGLRHQEKVDSLETVYFKKELSTKKEKKLGEYIGEA